jgi:hypothetical protein
MKTYRNFADTKNNFIGLPKWYTESVHKSLVGVMKEANKLMGCKYLRDLSETHEEMGEPKFGLGSCKELCDLIEGKTKTLEDLLEDWDVLEPGTWENENSEYLGNWYAVSNDEGIVAYFGKEDDALRFRLAEINRVLNG